MQNYFVVYASNTIEKVYIHKYNSVFTAWNISSTNIEQMLPQAGVQFLMVAQKVYNFCSFSCSNSSDITDITVCSHNLRVQQLLYANLAKLGYRVVLSPNKSSGIISFAARFWHLNKMTSFML